MNYFNKLYTRSWRNLATLLIAIFITDIVGVIIYYKLAQEFVSRQPTELNVNAGIVFFGDFNKSTRKIGRDTISRLEHAYALYMSKRIRKIVCVGGARKSEKLFGSFKMRDYLIDNGIDKINIFCDSLSYDTKTNWFEASKIIDNNHIQKIIIISSPLHVYRISKIIDRENVHFSPYTYRNDTVLDYLSIYRSIHYELIAFFATVIFPEGFYLKILRYIRN